ncbi:MAG TPA: beta-ketoacyl-ACP synthase III [Saprospiraceae bacterium]|nr:beta-ketoacyl-ACP synthase III [Saprospiraceae bacterium]
MSTIRAAIKGVHSFVPKDILTNKDLESMVDTNDEWIVARTGIQERHIMRDPNFVTSDMGAAAVEALLKKTGLSPLDIDLLICATVTPDYFFPDTGTLICYKIGAKNAFAYDIQAACSGFLFAATTGAKFVESGAYKNVIVVGSDKMSTITDYTDRATCILFGDAAAAILLQPDTSGNGLLDSWMRVDGVGAEFLHMKGGGSKNPPTHETVDKKWHFLYQDGKPVFKAAVKGMAEAITEILKRNNLQPEDIKYVVPHQANLRIIQAVADLLKFPMEKVMVNIQKYGNTTAATLPLCLWEWEDQLKPGDLIILTAFGGGYTWGASLWSWAY